MQRQPRERSTQDIDRMLLNRISQKELRSFETLYDRHAQVIYNLILRIVHEPSAAEELTQEFFWQVWQKAAQYASSGSVVAWLYQLARSQALNFLQQQPVRAPVASPELTELESSLHFHTSSAESEVEQAWRRQQVMQALDSLPNEQRLCLELAYFEALSQREIAHQTNSPVGTVRTRMNLGLEKLEQILQAVGYLEGSHTPGDTLPPIAAHSTNQEDQSVTSRILSDIDLQTLLPGFVLDALSPDEMSEVEAYLQAHPEWYARAAALMETVTSLAHAAPRAPLPERVREQLLPRIRSDIPLIETRSPKAAASRLRPLAAAAAPTDSRVRGMRRIPAAQPKPQPAARSWFGIFWRAVGIAGALAAIALLAVISWRLQQTVAQLTPQVQALQTELTQAQQSNNELQQTASTLQTQLDQQTDQWQFIATADQIIPLAGQTGTPNARGAFYRRGNEALLLLSGLAPLAEGETYQLWLLSSLEQSIPSDLFQVTNPEFEVLAIPLDPAVGELVGIGVSIEPAGGSQTPTTVILLGSAP